jgi:hypothetical protein
MKLIPYIIFLYAGLVIGKHVGFKEGVTSIDFDRANANLKLQQCLRIVRHE